MHQQSFVHQSRTIGENLAFLRRGFHKDIGCRRRGIWQYAQDTGPIRACFLNNPKELRTLGTVSPLVTVRNSSKKANKYSVSARHG